MSVNELCLSYCIFTVKPRSVLKECLVWLSVPICQIFSTNCFTDLIAWLLEICLLWTSAWYHLVYTTFEPIHMLCFCHLVAIYRFMDYIGPWKSLSRYSRILRSVTQKSWLQQIELAHSLMRMFSALYRFVEKMQL